MFFFFFLKQACKLQRLFWLLDPMDLDLELDCFGYKDSQIWEKIALLWVSDDFPDLEDNLRNIFPTFGNSLQAKKIDHKGSINRKEEVCHGNPVNSYLIEQYTYQYYVTLKVARKIMKFKSLIESSKVAWDDGHISSKLALTCND